MINKQKIKNQEKKVENICHKEKYFNLFQKNIR